MSAWTSAAARNNAEWCDALCRTHGASTTFDNVAWTSRTRTPPFYPDAVTLACELDVPELLTRIDTGPGCSIKDSFASLELTDAGFEVLFDATWIVRLPGGETSPVHDPAWEAVCDGEAIEAWEQAWRGDDGPTGLFRPELLDNPAVTVIQVRTSDGLVAGAVLNRSPDATGLSNFFARPGAPTSAWAGCLSFADTLHAGSALVSYASGAALDAARSTGFVAGGRLRVWHRNANPRIPL